MKWIGRAAASAAILGLAAFGGWACGDDGGGTLSLDEYFEELAALDQKFQEEGEAADAAFESENLDDIKDAFGDATDAADEFVNGISDLNPPDEVKDAHDAAVAAGTDLVNELENAVDRVQDAESENDLIAIFADEAFSDASERFTEACFELQGIADANNIDVTLNCG